MLQKKRVTVIDPTVPALPKLGVMLRPGRAGATPDPSGP